MSIFIDRKRELSALDERYRQGKAEFIILYGRRRIGKSGLIDRFLGSAHGIRLLAREESKHLQLKKFSYELGDFFSDDFLKTTSFSDWDSFFTYLSGKAKDRVVIAIDEFPYLVAVNRALPSLIQRWWDSVGSRSNVVLILAGSQQSMMRSLVSSDGALYGRPTRAHHLRPFDYYYAGRFAAGWSPEDKVRLYAVAGGVPDYLEEFDATLPFRDELLRVAYSPTGRLFREAPDLLRSEFVEPRTYETVLRAIANGYVTPGEIAAQAGLAGANRVTPYLEKLIDLGLVERRVPPPDVGQPRSRNSQYVIADPYLRFYFALVDPWRSAIQQGQGAGVLGEVWGEEFDRFVSWTFEDVARQHLQRLAGTGAIGPFTNVGFWWFAGGDIDAAAMTGPRLAAAASVKWTREQVKPGDVADLRRDVGRVAPGDRPHLFLYSRSGYDRNIAPEPDLTLVGLRELFAAELEYERPRGSRPRA